MSTKRLMVLVASLLVISSATSSAQVEAVGLRGGTANGSKLPELSPEPVLSSAPILLHAESGILSNTMQVSVDAGLTAVNADTAKVNFIWFTVTAPPLIRCYAWGQPFVEIHSLDQVVWKKIQPNPPPLVFLPFSVTGATKGEYVFFHEKPDVYVSRGHAYIRVDYITQISWLIDKCDPLKAITERDEIDIGSETGSLQLNIPSPPPVPTRSALYSVEMLSATNGWAVGEQGVILHWDGNAWTAVNSPTTNTLREVDAVTATDAWAVGDQGTILHWNGTDWSTISSPTSQTLTSVDMVTATDGWAVSGTILHWNGSAWTSVRSPVNYLSSIAMVSATDGWAGGYGGVLLHWNGSAWTRSRSPTTNNIASIDMISASDGWAVTSRCSTCNGTALRWNGSSWISVSQWSFRGFTSVSMVTATDGWAVSIWSEFSHWNGASWVNVVSPQRVGLNSVDMVSATDGWAVGYEGAIFRWNGTTWTNYNTPVTSTPTPPVPQPAAPTQVIVFHPTGVSGQEQSGYCWTSSLVLARTDAWRCTVGNQITDPCFSTPGDNQSVICGADPLGDGTGFKLRLTQPLPAPDTSFQAMWAWMVKLLDGTICYPMQGASLVFGGKRINFVCAGGWFILGNPTQGQVWTAESVQLSADSSSIADSRQVAISTVWR